MKREVICITAGQRSGTTALRSLLSNGSHQIKDLCEIFDTATLDKPESFFGFCRKNHIGLADLLTGPQVAGLCEKYLSVLRSCAEGKHMLIDVKFNSWGTIRLPWTYIHQEPFFLTRLKSLETKFIFVWRRDIAAQILSDWVSRKLQKWHNLTEDDGRPVELDVDAIRQHTAVFCQSERYFFQNLSAYPKTLMLSYESMFDESSSLTATSRTRLSHFLEEELAEPETKYYFRNRLDKRSCVLNYDAVVDAILATSSRYRQPELSMSVELRL